MGTNYYYYSRNSPLDASIRILERNNENNIHVTALELLREAKEGERLHIGKSSTGWCFSLHVTDSIRSLEDWKAKFSEGVILDEYGREHSPEEMLRIITDRRSYTTFPAIPAMATYFVGPNNLLRHKVGPHCSGYGDGTWDLIEGEFS
jgi:hypothetical protein